MHNHSYENEFNLHVNEISFSYEKMGTKTRFEEEAQGNSEMAYYKKWKHQVVSIIVCATILNWFKIKQNKMENKNILITKLGSDTSLERHRAWKQKNRRYEEKVKSAYEPHGPSGQSLSDLLVTIYTPG